MSQENQKKRKQRPLRQDWKPHWLLKLVYRAWMVVFTLGKVALGAAATVGIICGICVVVFVGSLSDFLESDILKDAKLDLDDAVQEANSFIYYYDAEGNAQLQQKIFADIYSSWADYEDIPEDLVHAAIAIEDKRFYEHQGVDWITTLKACAGMFFGDADAGGSTITQQLVKNHTGDNDVTVQRKLLEIFRANDIEKRYSKDVIMEYYLNEIYFGKKCKGVRAAAEKYFGKELEMLTTAECASLISITNNPSIYNPYSTSEYTFGEKKELMNGYQRNAYRKEIVLAQMLEQEWITEEEYEEAMAQEIVNKDGIDLEDQFANCKSDSCDYRGLVSTYKHESGGAYYCPVCNTDAGIIEGASLEVYSYFTDTVIEDVAMAFAERDGMTWNEETKAYYKDYISRAGLHIFSTLDMDVQNQVDKIYTDLSQIPETRSGQQLQSAIVIIDNSTGDIVAMAGGVGEKVVHDGFNRAVDSELQSGSSIKPLSVYGPAFNIDGYSPATVVKDLPLLYNGSRGWPKNDDRWYRYSYTLHDAIVRSVNAVAANTLDQIGKGYAFDFAKNKFGLSTLTREFITSSGQVMSDEDYAPLAAGAQTVGITVRDMASAFSTFANKGVYRRGRTFTKVYDNSGNLVLDNTQQTEQILTEKATNYMNYCLRDAVTGGTGTAARLANAYAYGKTGSTSSMKDRWFCGYTKYYTAAVWCGYDQPEQIFLVGDGSNPACRLFKKVMDPIHKGLEQIDIVDRSKLYGITVCLDCGKLATEACDKDIRTGGGFKRTSSVSVYREDIPKDRCDCHIMVDYCETGKGVATEWCNLFAAEEELKFKEVSLVRMTEDEFKELKKAYNQGVVEAYLRDDYIYLVNKRGEDAAFEGFKNTLNKEEDHPYKVCPVHTKEAWETYLKEKEEAEKPVDPPVDPENPVDPETPVDPENPVVPPVTPEDPVDPPQQPVTPSTTDSPVVPQPEPTEDTPEVG